MIQLFRHHPVHGAGPLPQAELAGRLGITQGHLSRIESGQTRVRDIDKLTRYARVLGIPEGLLWFEVDDNVPHTELPSVTAYPGGKDIPSAAAPTTAMVAESLLATLDQYVRTDMLIGPHSVLPLVAHQIELLKDIAETSRGRTLARLRIVHARFAEFRGWLHQDGGDQRAAAEWTALAHTITGAAEDQQLRAYILHRRGNIAADSDDPRAEIALARAPLHEPTTALSPPLRALALRQVAHAHARLGQAQECSAALEEAFDSAAADAPDDDELTHYCTPAYIAMEAAGCWLELGQPDRAINILEPALEHWQPDNQRDLGRAIALLSVAQARRHQRDEALAAASSAARIVAVTRSARTERALHDAVRALRNTGAEEHAAELRAVIRKALR
ncbi:helix-turn-helix domain-containing protein [Nocardia acidivorans]|uniref:helix-turn-helix domain-containing protein n=1 Tax=Nocardia acidivorans TaxID=404580 RepID=UPI001471D73A|nr:helix-turn-helix transcriptional regulator [Nocardia acidivorans]